MNAAGYVLTCLTLKPSRTHSLVCDNFLERQIYDSWGLGLIIDITFALGGDTRRASRRDAELDQHRIGAVPSPPASHE